MPPSSHPVSDADASRFLAQATFGPTLDDINRLKKIGFDAWMLEQMNRGYASHEHTLAVRTMLDEHRNGVSDHSRRLWTVLIFMLWHAIFVEHSVTPQIKEPHYPVQL